MNGEWHDEPMPPLQPWWQTLLGGVIVAIVTFALIWVGAAIAVIAEGP